MFSLLLLDEDLLIDFLAVSIFTCGICNLIFATSLLILAVFTSTRGPPMGSKSSCSRGLHVAGVSPGGIRSLRSATYRRRIVLVALLGAIG